jgi:hypothetical protein
MSAPPLGSFNSGANAPRNVPGRNNLEGAQNLPAPSSAVAGPRSNVAQNVGRPASQPMNNVEANTRQANAPAPALLRRS